MWDLLPKGLFSLVPVLDVGWPAVSKEQTMVFERWTNIECWEKSSCCGRFPISMHLVSLWCEGCAFPFDGNARGFIARFRCLGLALHG